MNRRNFLARAGTAAAGALGALAAPAWLNAAEPKDKTRIRVVYALHGEKQARPDWPNKGFDFRPRHGPHQRDAGASSARGSSSCLRWPPARSRPRSCWSRTRPPADIDGYLVYQMNCWNRVVQTLATSGKPVLYADFQFGGSGGFLVYTAAFLRSQAPNVGFVASSKTKDLVEAVKCFQVVKQGGSASDFVAATAQVRLKGTPGAGRLAGKPDPVQVPFGG